MAGFPGMTRCCKGSGRRHPACGACPSTLPLLRPLCRHYSLAAQALSCRLPPSSLLSLPQHACPTSPLSFPHRKALEPPDDPSDADSEEDLWNRRRPLAADAGPVPRSWGAVRAGCLEAVLGLAIYAKVGGR